MIDAPAKHRTTTLAEIVESAPHVVVPEYVRKRLNGGYRDRPIICDPDDPKSYAPTCVAHYSKDRGTRMVKDKTHPEKVRPFTTKEYARLQGVPDWFKFSGSDSEIYKQIGNGVAVPMAEWVGTEAVKYFN